jgi:hypothetical protein
MASEYDPAEFVDGDLEGRKAPGVGAGLGGSAAGRAPTRQEVDSKVVEAQQKLVELKRAQEELERERVALEETRRRQHEFDIGRQEMVQSLTRGLGLLEEAEFGARREAEQMAKALVDLREALAKIQSVNEETWTRDNFGVELTRALTALENARMEWNSARLKFPVLAGATEETKPETPAPTGRANSVLAGQPFGELCWLGLALTWPVAAALLLALAALVFLLVRR